jgi:hypothetical protein
VEGSALGAQNTGSPPGWQGDRKENVKYHLTVEDNSRIIWIGIGCKTGPKFTQLQAKLFDRFE